jgi:tRNA dimethylallyltransferase
MWMEFPVGLPGKGWFCDNISTDRIKEIGLGKIEMEKDSGRNPGILALVGPTGIGKTEVAMALAQILDIPIISCDSMQIYRLMDIGTAKPTPAEQKQVPHYLIDIVNPDEPYDAFRYRQDALAVVNEVSTQNKKPFVVGGTGFYLKALLEGLFENVKIPPEFRESLMDKYKDWDNLKLHEYLATADPESARKLHPNDRKRVLRALEVYEYSGKPLSQHHREHKQKQSFLPSKIIGLRMPMPELYERIRLRVKIMLSKGWIDEVVALRSKGYAPSLNAMQGLGYKQINDFLDGRADLAPLEEQIAQATCQYAKRQMTWFRGNPEIIWLEKKDAKLVEKACLAAKDFWDI